ncbi:MAG: IS66 family transposase [Chloroflexi bacterium]|nr:MAG: IS66 family transposase [Chloroflexota bacterium]
MKRDELEQLSKNELIELQLAQNEQLARLQAAFEQLKADYEALLYKFEHNQKKPPPTSKNSSQPPSRDQKPKKPKHHGRKRKHGPPEGHEKHERQLVANPDQVVELHPQRCQACQTDLSQAAGQLTKVNQVTELPPAKAQVLEVRQYEVACLHCGRTEVAQPPAGLEMERTFGARLEATVVYLRQEQHLSYQRTQEALRLLSGVDISQGAIDHIMRRAGQSALAQVPAIQAVVTRSPVIHCDETGCRVEGSNWWEWVFCTPQAVLHLIRHNRSADIIREVMGTFEAEVWVSDCHTAQLKAPSKERQLCLAHQHRNLQALVEAQPQLLWPKEMQVLFQHAIHVHHERQKLSPAAFEKQVARVERICERLLNRPNAPPEIGKLLRRYQKHRPSLFVFLHRTDVEPTNNVAEQALRPSVIHRKVTNGFRSGWGAKAYAAIASVIHTAERSGGNAFQAIQSLFGPPALPLQARCE